MNFEDSECVAVKTNDVGKTIIKPPICEWCIVLPTYDVLRDIGPGDFKHNLMNIYHPKGMSIGPARIWDSGFLPAKSTSCYPLAAGMIVVPKKGCFDQQKPSVLRGLLHGPGMGLKLCTQKNGVDQQQKFYQQQIGNSPAKHWGQILVRQNGMPEARERSMTETTAD